jgi:hypothetical protein
MGYSHYQHKDAKVVIIDNTPGYDYSQDEDYNREEWSYFEEDLLDSIRNSLSDSFQYISEGKDDGALRRYAENGQYYIATLTWQDDKLVIFGVRTEIDDYEPGTVTLAKANLGRHADVFFDKLQKHYPLRVGRGYVSSPRKLSK